MQARTLTATSTWVRDKRTCNDCHRTLRAGDQVLVHGFGSKATFDHKDVVFHALCVIEALSRFRTPPLPSTSQAAAAFRAEIERVRAGGPVIVSRV